MGILEESIAFATNFLTQILIIIGASAAATKYILAEIRKGNERLGKKILGPEQDGKVGKGGLLDELRTELKADIKREVEAVRVELTNMITDTQKELINEFRRTSTKISYMSRDFSRMEKSLEKMSAGRYTAARDDTIKDEYGQYDDIGLNDIAGSFTGQSKRYNKNQRTKKAKQINEENEDELEDGNN